MEKLICIHYPTRKEKSQDVQQKESQQGLVNWLEQGLQAQRGHT